jgi:hypothetical protein
MTLSYLIWYRGYKTLNLPFIDNKWIPVATSGKPPTKRYQHSAYYDNEEKKIIIYGGINRMTVLQDVHYLALGANPFWR